MQSTSARALLGALLLIAAVVLFVVLQEGGDDGTAGDAAGGAPAGQVDRDGERGDALQRPAPALEEIEIENGKPVGGVAELEFQAGERVRFEVRSDVADEVHVHGYDVSLDVDAGKTVRFDFPATIQGVFEVELEERGEGIAELRVGP